MKNWKKVLITVVPATLALSFTSMAGQWHQDMNGWWYENDDGSYLRNGWYWVDGNEDGLAECYYFGSRGYVANKTGQAEGCEVNEDGAWVVDEVVQVKEVPKPNNSAAMAAYMAAQEKNAALDSIDTDVYGYISMGTDEETVDMTLDVSLQMKGVNSDDIEFVMDGTIDMMGMELPFSSFYTDGYVYTDTLGMKVKQATPVYDAIQSANSTLEMADIQTDMITDMQMQQDGEDTIITYSLDTSKMTSFLNDMMGMDIFAELDDYGYEISYEIGRADGEAVINKDGYYARETAFLNMDMSMKELESGETETISYEMYVEINVNNPGEPVEFDLPSTEGYVDSAELTTIELAE